MPFRHFHLVWLSESKQVHIDTEKLKLLKKTRAYVSHSHTLRSIMRSPRSSSRRHIIDFHVTTIIILVSARLALSSPNLPIVLMADPQNLYNRQFSGTERKAPYAGIREGEGFSHPNEQGAREENKPPVIYFKVMEAHKQWRVLGWFVSRPALVYRASLYIPLHVLLWRLDSQDYTYHWCV